MCELVEKKCTKQPTDVFKTNQNKSKLIITEFFITRQTGIWKFPKSNYFGKIKIQFSLKIKLRFMHMKYWFDTIKKISILRKPCAVYGTRWATPTRVFQIISTLTKLKRLKSFLIKVLCHCWSSMQNIKNCVMQNLEDFFPEKSGRITVGRRRNCIGQ